MLRLITLSALLSSLLIAAPVAQAQSQEISSRIDPFWNTPIGPRVMVTLCHIPPGNPANAQTIEVNQAAVPAHLAHGDSLGACPDEADDCPANQAPIPKTGQTECWDEFGMSIPCAGTGQDGEYQNGTSIAPRLTDNGDGTVKDNLTGLIWLKDANCFGARPWTDALSDANTLANGSCGLAEHSVGQVRTGEWRLPNVRELHSLMDFSQFAPALPVGHLFAGVQSSGLYWSSTTYANAPSALMVSSPAHRSSTDELGAVGDMSEREFAANALPALNTVW